MKSQHNVKEFLNIRPKSSLKNKLKQKATLENRTADSIVKIADKSNTGKKGDLRKLNFSNGLQCLERDVCRILLLERYGIGLI